MCIILCVTCYCQQYKNIECCTKMLLGWICIANNNKPYLCLHINWHFSQILTTFGVSGLIVITVPSFKFHGNPCSDPHWYMWTNRQTHDEVNRWYLQLCNCTWKGERHRNMYGQCGQLHWTFQWLLAGLMIWSSDMLFMKLYCESAGGKLFNNGGLEKGAVTQNFWSLQT